MKCDFFSSFLFGLALILSLFTAGCKKTEADLVSPLAPPAWIQGSWASPDYDKVGSFGWRWEFSQDNAVCYFYRQGQLFLEPLDFFQLFVNCQKGDSEYTCKLSDNSSDAYYEIGEILEYNVSKYQLDQRYRFTKLTPMTFSYENIYDSQATIGIVFTKQ
jgi:hypothetical protein